MPRQSNDPVANVKIKIDEDGGFTIPLEFRDALGIRAGDEIVMTWKDNELRIRKAQPRNVGKRRRARG